MPRFTAIEGLRAWLAWAVVAWHVVQFTGLARADGPMTWFPAIGDSAVMVFVAISGDETSADSMSSAPATAV